MFVLDICLYTFILEGIFMPELSYRPQLLVTDDAATTFPASTVDGYTVGDSRLVRTFIAFDGASAAVIRKLTRNRTTGVWHGEMTTTQTDPLVPADGDTVRYWEVARNDEIQFQIVSVTGGDVSVYASIVE